ncbi:MAG TPA: metal-dependent hydrolase [Thermotogota bacterium]|nr:metal-dependent hydrolase [Thermotogota bacterium]HRW34942.1 metal-dependent hydrolase [Thermotogota bacterium]
MPNFKVHVATGIIVFPVMIPLYNLFHNTFKLVAISDRILIFSFIFFVLGSDAPDLDHKNAYMHRVAKVIIWIIATIYLFFVLKERIPLWFPRLNILRNETVLFYISILLGWVFSAFLSAITPPHRGPFHSFLAPVVFGLITGGLFYILEIKTASPSEAMSNAVYIGTSSMLGYALHVTMDYIQSKSNRNSTS